MAVVTMRQLLESGVHFGHQTRRWNPKMKRFIMTERNGIYIIDLQQSLAYIDRSYAFIKETVAKGGTIMFVGTKKQAQEAIAEQAMRVGMPYVNQRWLGGMLTNFQTVHQRINRLKELDEIDFDDVAGSSRTKKELLQMRRERDKLNKSLGGIREMTRTPSRRLDRRHQQGAPRRRGGAQAAHPDHRHPGLQLRPRPRRLPDPGQRRRDPRRRPADPRRRGRRGRGPDRPLGRQGRGRRGRRRGAPGRLGARAPGRRGRGCRRRPPPVATPPPRPPPRRPPAPAPRPPRRPRSPRPRPRSPLPRLSSRSPPPRTAPRLAEEPAARGRHRGAGRRGRHRGAGRRGRHRGAGRRGRHRGARRRGAAAEEATAERPPPRSPPTRRRPDHPYRLRGSSRTQPWLTSPPPTSRSSGR